MGLTDGGIVGKGSQSPLRTKSYESEKLAGGPALGPRRRKVKRAQQNEYSRIRARIRNQLQRVRQEQNLLDAYHGGGWNNASREKFRPEAELARAEAQVLQSKLAVREAMRQLDTLSSKGAIQETAFDGDGSIHSELIICSVCSGGDVKARNDILLCDGECNRAFHQKCLSPPLKTADIPPGDEGWLCPACDCKVDCIYMINKDSTGGLNLKSTWKEVFPVEAAFAEQGAVGKPLPMEEWPSDDSDDSDFNPDSAPEREPSIADSEDGHESSDEESSNASDLSDDVDSEADVPVAELQLAVAAFGPLGRTRSASDLAPAALPAPARPEPSSLVVSGKRKRAVVDYSKLNNELFGSGEAFEGEQEEDGEWGSPKCPRRQDTQPKRCPPLPDHVQQVLQAAFEENQLPPRAVKEALATQLGMPRTQIERWLRRSRYLELQRLKAAQSSEQGTTTAEDSQPSNSGPKNGAGGQCQLLGLPATHNQTQTHHSRQPPPPNTPREAPPRAQGGDHPGLGGKAKERVCLPPLEVEAMEEDDEPPEGSLKLPDSGRSMEEKVAGEPGVQTAEEKVPSSALQAHIPSVNRRKKNLKVLLRQRTLEERAWESTSPLCLSTTVKPRNLPLPLLLEDPSQGVPRGCEKSPQVFKKGLAFRFLENLLPTPEADSSLEPQMPWTAAGLLKKEGGSPNAPHSAPRSEGETPKGSPLLKPAAACTAIDAEEAATLALVAALAKELRPLRPRSNIPTKGEGAGHEADRAFKKKSTALSKDAWPLSQHTAALGKAPGGLAAPPGGLRLSVEDIDTRPISKNGLRIGRTPKAVLALLKQQGRGHGTAERQLAAKRLKPKPKKGELHPRYTKNGRRIGRPPKAQRSPVEGRGHTSARATAGSHSRRWSSISPLSGRSTAPPSSVAPPGNEHPSPGSLAASVPPIPSPRLGSPLKPLLGKKKDPQAEAAEEKPAPFFTGPVLLPLPPEAGPAPLSTHGGGSGVMLTRNGKRWGRPPKANKEEWMKLGQVALQQALTTKVPALLPSAEDLAAGSGGREAKEEERSPQKPALLLPPKKQKWAAWEESAEGSDGDDFSQLSAASTEQEGTQQAGDRGPPITSPVPKGPRGKPGSPAIAAQPLAKEAEAEKLLLDSALAVLSLGREKTTSSSLEDGTLNGSVNDTALGQAHPELQRAGSVELHSPHFHHRVAEETEADSEPEAPRELPLVVVRRVRSKTDRRPAGQPLAALELCGLVGPTTQGNREEGSGGSYLELQKRCSEVEGRDCGAGGYTEGLLT